MATPIQPVPKKSNTGLIIGLLLLIAVFLCCCCLLIGGGLTFWVYNQVKQVYSSINELPELPVIPLPTDESGASPELPAIPADVIPQGGIGDDVLRANAWVSVLLQAGMSGCVATDATKTSIEVLQYPDSDGVWKEKWTVTCEDGSNKAYDLTFSPDSAGKTNIGITPAK